MMQDYSPADAWIWDTTAATPGTYTVQVMVRNAGSGVYKDAYKTLVYTIAALSCGRTKRYR